MTWHELALLKDFYSQGGICVANLPHPFQENNHCFEDEPSASLGSPCGLLSSAWAGLGKLATASEAAPMEVMAR